jgi:hypothetical protein
MRASPASARLRPWVLLLLATLAPAAARAGDPAPAGVPPAEDDEESRGYVGFSPVVAELLSPEERKELGVSSGFVVRGVTPGMPAEVAGLRAGDVIVSIGGKPIPATKAFTPESSKEETEPFWNAWKAMTKDVKPGSQVVMVVRRGKEERTLTATAVDYDTRKRFEYVAEEEASYPKLPPLAEAGPPKAETFDFEKVEDSRPEGFLPFLGMWEVRAEDGPKENQVLLQDSVVEPWAFCVATGPGRALADGNVSVRFRPVSGREDASGGIVFRLKDRKNYYVARANALETNLRLYVVVDGERRTIGDASVPAPKMGAWHTLEVRFAGDELKAVLDGKHEVSAKDPTFASGWTGLWTKADSTTEFDDLKIQPAAPPPPK